MGKQKEALEAWQQSLEHARTLSDVEATARAQAGVGLARAALGEVVEASSGLEQALGKLPQGDPMWAAAAEALAGARLSRGDADGAHRLWSELLELGREMGEGAVHARAMAGLGLIALVRGRSVEGQDGLENAAFRMREQSSPTTLPVVLFRLSELAHAEGRLEDSRSLALEAESIARELLQLPMCVACLGQAARCLLDIGVPHEARMIAEDASTLARSLGPVESIMAIGSVLPAVRVLIALGAMEDAGLILPNAPPGQTDSGHGVDDPVGGLLALKSRIVIERNPTVAVALARGVVDRKGASLVWARARHVMDAAHTLVRAKDQRAKEAVSKALDLVEGTQFKLLQMEAGFLAGRVDLSGEALSRSNKILESLDHSLGSPEGFRARWSKE